MCVFVCMIECAGVCMGGVHIDWAGSDSLLCCSLVQFHTPVSHTTGQQLLLHCPEGLCVWLCNISAWFAGLTVQRFVSPTHWAGGSRCYNWSEIALLTALHSVADSFPHSLTEIHTVYNTHTWHAQNNCKGLYNLSHGLWGALMKLFEADHWSLISPWEWL